MVEALGNLARWRRTPGQAAAVSQAEPLLEGVAAAAVAADKAYDSQSLIDAITASGAQAVIPPPANRAQPRSFERHIYTTRYDKLDRRYEAFIAIAAAWIWPA